MADPVKDARLTAWGALAWRVRLLFGAGAFVGLFSAVLAVVVADKSGGLDSTPSVAAAAAVVLVFALNLMGWLILRKRPLATRLACHAWHLMFWSLSLSAAVAWGFLLSQAFPSWPAASAWLLAALSVTGFSLQLLISTFSLPLAVLNLGLFVATAWHLAGSPAWDEWGGLGGSLSLLAAGLTVLAVCGALMAYWLHRAMLEGYRAKSSVVSLQNDLLDQESQIKAESDHRNRVERELTLAHDAAESAIRAKSEFLATMSHEIRTPLNGVLPILDLLLDSKLSTDQREHVETAHKSSRHLLRLINDVLDFAKVEAGKLELEYIEIDLQELVESVTNLMRRSAERKGLKLDVDIDPEAPSAVRGDPIRLRQVLTNLVSNAVKFTESGSVRVEIKQLRVGRKEVNLRFSVVDSGVGMSAQTAQRLFQSFTQADASTTRKHGGTGLGLAISKRLVELMGGEIGVFATPGKGSTFWFELPMRRSKRDVPPARKDLSEVRALTVIKDPVQRQAVSDWLVAWSVKEEQAESAIVALSKLKTAAMLGESWAFELLLADARDQEQMVQTIVREARAEAALSPLPVVVAGLRFDAPLTEEPNVVCIDAPIQKQELRRVLVKVLDVEEFVGGQPVGEGDELVSGFPDSVAYDSDSHLVRDVPKRFAGRVLLAEDNPVNSAVARKLLQHLGVECVVAEDGVAAIDSLEAGDFDLVLMDLQMPNMDGFEATAEIRRREALGQMQKLPIIAITANAMRGDRDKCLEGGMDDYLAKPVEMETLRAMLSRWLRNQPPPVAGGHDDHLVKNQDEFPADEKKGLAARDERFITDQISSIQGLDDDVLADDLIDSISRNLESSWGESDLLPESAPLAEDPVSSSVDQIRVSELTLPRSVDISQPEMLEALAQTPQEISNFLDESSEVEDAVELEQYEPPVPDDDDDEFAEIDSALLRELAEGDENFELEELSKPVVVAFRDEVPSSREASSSSVASPTLVSEPELDQAKAAQWSEYPPPERSDHERVVALQEISTDSEPISMPTDLDWMSRHADEVEVIEITSSGAKVHDEQQIHDITKPSGSLRKGSAEAAGEQSTWLELDLDVVHELREIMGDDFQSIIITYLENAPTQIEQLEMAAKAGDIDTMVRPAHSLKSSSANVGALRVSQLAKEIETDARERERTAAVAALPELREAFERVANELAEIAAGPD